jgi:hypothetical protein
MDFEFFHLSTFILPFDIFSIFDWNLAEIRLNMIDGFVFCLKRQKLSHNASPTTLIWSPHWFATPLSDICEHGLDPILMIWAKRLQFLIKWLKNKVSFCDYVEPLVMWDYGTFIFMVFCTFFWDFKIIWVHLPSFLHFLLGE